MEFILVFVLVMIPIVYSKLIDTKSFINEDGGWLMFLKEKDYDFYVASKYGESVNPNVLFAKRIQLTFYGFLSLSLFLIAGFSFLNFIATIVFGFMIFKSQYMSLKGYYKKYMSQIDQMLPYYLKGLEILCQNYTIPVALSRSIDDAPEIFKPGLREMIAKIDTGDSSIEPYMDFAVRYPVRDSMRMMRLLYRLGLGAQENKYQQLLLFSKSVSALQNKAREMKYKARLASMEKRTMLMLVVTGGGTMFILLLSMLMFFGI